MPKLDPWKERGPGMIVSLTLVFFDASRWFFIAAQNAYFQEQWPVYLVLYGRLYPCKFKSLNACVGRWDIVYHPYSNRYVRPKFIVISWPKFSKVVSGGGYGFHQWDITIADFTKQQLVVFISVSLSFRINWLLTAKSVVTYRSVDLWAMYMVYQTFSLCPLFGAFRLASMVEIFSLRWYDHHWSFLPSIDDIIPRALRTETWSLSTIIHHGASFSSMWTISSFGQYPRDCQHCQRSVPYHIASSGCLEFALAIPYKNRRVSYVSRGFDVRFLQPSIVRYQLTHWSACIASILGLFYRIEELRSTDNTWIVVPTWITTYVP